MAFLRSFKRLVIFPIMIVTLKMMTIIKEYVLFVLALGREDDPIPKVVRTPEERFEGLEALGYNFKANYVELPYGGDQKLPRMHYVDVGPKDAKETILCLHGEPSWSFLYRKMIPVLTAAGYRVVAPDFIGFGKSDKYTNPESYSHELHKLSLRLLLDYLKLKNITLVCQDWGGLTGLPVVREMSNRFNRLVIMNTGLPYHAMTKGDGFMNNVMKYSPFMLWRYLAEFWGCSMSIRMIFNGALLNPTNSIIDGYEAPFPSSLYKAGAARWPLLVPITTVGAVAIDMWETQMFLRDSWSDRPALVMFGRWDAITYPERQMFLDLLPEAVDKTIPKARHFLQEDQGEEVAANIVQFINGCLQKD